jgi:hypothetical protein
MKSYLRPSVFICGFVLFCLVLCSGCEPFGDDNDETITVNGDYIVIQNQDGTTELVNKPKEEIKE